MITRPLVFLDTETDSRGPRRRVWEFAAIRRELDGTEKRTQFFINLGDLSNADPESLRVGRFWERHPGVQSTVPSPNVHSPAYAAHLIRQVTHEAMIVGACPWFDTEALSRLLCNHSQLPTWHYQMRDVESMAHGFQGKDEGGLAACADALDIDYSDLSLHTAMGDATLAMRVYDEIMTPEAGE